MEFNSVGVYEDGSVVRVVLNTDQEGIVFKARNFLQSDELINSVDRRALIHIAYKLGYNDANCCDSVATIQEAE